MACVYSKQFGESPKFSQEMIDTIEKDSVPNKDEDIHLVKDTTEVNKDKICSGDSVTKAISKYGKVTYSSSSSITIKPNSDDDRTKILTTARRMGWKQRDPE